MQQAGGRRRCQRHRATDGGAIPERSEALRRCSEARERKGVSYSAIDLVWGAIVRLLRELTRSLCILVEIEAEPGEVRCDRRLVRRGLVKTLEHVVKLGCFIFLAI